MQSEQFNTFRVRVEDAVAWVTFDFPPVNVQGLPMLADLNKLADQLETDREIKVVVFPVRPSRDLRRPRRHQLSQGHVGNSGGARGR